MPLPPLPTELQRQLFDPSQFQADLTLSRSPVPAYKRWLSKAEQRLQEWFAAGRPIEQLLAGRTWVIDQLLTQAWAHLDWGQVPSVALIAVGGYGRGELHPHSDIDLLILLEHPEQERYREPLERFITLLWDLNLQIGHSVRTCDECVEAARDELATMTNLLESRTLVGPEALRQHLLAALDREQIWPSPEFLQAKYLEQRARHRKFNDTEYNLEPNIKSSPGGLRDLQMLGWVTRRKFGADTGMSDLVRIGFLTEEEYRSLVRDRNLLWQIRWALHQLTGRAEDRLLFDFQRELAERFGYRDSAQALAVEQFMQQYYRAVLDLGQLGELLLQHFDDSILHPEAAGTATALNDRFQVRNHYLEPIDPELFSREPGALLELYVCLGQHSELLGATASALRGVRANLHRIDAAFRADPRNQARFLELLRSPYALAANLRRLLRHGLLTRYLPEFAHCIGQMQHDLFHQYTVDAHSLLVIKFMRRFAYRSSAEQFPLAHQLVGQLAKPELLYLAGLLHDIAKGLGGRHATRGALIARSICHRHGLSRPDTRLVTWLVTHHLLMSTTSQRRDINSSEEIHRFARKVRSEERLNYLYCLTVADINATAPKLWNGWRASLLRQLYDSTRRALRNGLENPVDRHERIAEVQQQALEQLHEYGIDGARVRPLWEALGEEYFLRHSGDEISWHSVAILEHGDSQKPLIHLRDAGRERAEQGTQLFVYTPDQPHLFALCASALDRLQLSIHAARIITAGNGFSLDTFILHDLKGRPITQDPDRVALIEQRLAQQITQPEQYGAQIRRIPRRLKHFSRSAQVQLDRHPNLPLTIVEIHATDRPGLLAHIGQTFITLGLLVHQALIATLGERVEDVFFVTDLAQQPIEDPEQYHQIRQVLCQRINQFTGVRHKPSHG